MKKVFTLLNYGIYFQGSKTDFLSNFVFFSRYMSSKCYKKKTFKKRLGNISGDILKSVHFCYISKATWKYKIYFQVEKMFTNFEKNQ